MLGLGLDLALSRSRGGGAAAFNPVSLAPSVLYDPSDLSTLFQLSGGTGAVSANADPIGYLGDKSGNTKNMVQATAGLRPILSTAGGLKAVKFDGVDDFLGGPILSDVISAAEYDVIIAAKFNTSATNTGNYYQEDGVFAETIGGWFSVSARNTNFAMSGINGTVNVQAPYAIGTAAVFHARLVGGVVSIAVNLNAPATASGGPVGVLSGTVALGKNQGAAPETNADVNFYAMFARKTVLNPADLALVKTWAGAKAGIVL